VQLSLGDPVAQLALQINALAGTLPSGQPQTHSVSDAPDGTDIFNSDQGAQFTSLTFTEVLQREDITISMDGRGPTFDNIFVERLWRNVKYENVSLNSYATMDELIVALTW